MPFLRNSRHLWRVWRAIVRANMVREISFRANFVAGVVRQMLWLGIFIFFIDTVFNNTTSLAGWSQAEVLVVLALSRLIEGLMNALFVQNIMSLPEIVRRGNFDFFLTKPLPAQFYTAFHDFSLYSVSNILAGVVLLTYAILQLPSFAFINLGIFLIIAACGIVIYYCLLVTVATLVFFLDRFEALWGFNMLFSEPLTVPFDVFPRLPRVALTYLLPIAFTVYVPAQALTNRLIWWQIPVAVGLAVVFVVIANLAWRAGLRRYSSASS